MDHTHYCIVNPTGDTLHSVVKRVKNGFNTRAFLNVIEDETGTEVDALFFESGIEENNIPQEGIDVIARINNELITYKVFPCWEY